ncbi:chromate transporter [Deinococcus koreensis]|uniref:Chromate transporter n=1 Tax=Deinococcus koreensis TaxID=2054903 RepID=A0A2K3V1J3_9DEIO|nr:chromate transporter [Deinococcus koreensis]PNY82657.1 chromate transporter [Deinococcus koreensis]
MTSSPLRPTSAALPEGAGAPQPSTPAALFRVFTGVALSGVGGGLPAHTRRAVLAQGWMTDAQFAESYTLAQLTPGPNAVNLAAMIGAREAGGLGALAAVAGILCPGLIVMLGASALLVGVGLPPVLQSALRGAACAALAVLLTAAIPVVRVALRVRGGAVLSSLTFLALGALRLDLLPVFAALVGAGLILNRPRRVPPHD